MQCDECGRWCHGECAGLSLEKAEAIELYVCPVCRPNGVTGVVALAFLGNSSYRIYLIRIVSILSRESPCHLPSSPARKGGAERWLLRPTYPVMRDEQCKPKEL